MAFDVPLTTSVSFAGQCAIIQSAYVIRPCTIVYIIWHSKVVYVVNHTTLDLRYGAIASVVCHQDSSSKQLVIPLYIVCPIIVTESL